MTQLRRENDADSITLHMPKIVNSYIYHQTSNRSEWVREAGGEFLHVITNKLLPHLNTDLEGHQIISISKPSNSDLKTIYALVEGSGLFFSRSEFYRMSAFYKMLSDVLLNEIEEKSKEEPSDPNTVKVPIDIDENGDTIFKAYKILKKLDF